MSSKIDVVELAVRLEEAHQRAELGSPPTPEIAQEWVKAARSDAQLHGLALDILGHAHQHFSHHPLAQAAFSEAAQRYTKAGLKTSATTSLILLGRSYLLNGEPFSALDQWSKALLLARDSQDLAQCAKVYLGVGQVYIGFGDDESALRYNEMALKMSKVLGDIRLECEANVYVASDCYRLHRYSQALLAIDRAEVLLAQLEKNKVWTAEIVYYRGAIHAGQGQFVQAQLELEIAYELSTANDNLWGRLHALTALGEVLLETQNPTAESILLQALAMADQIQLERIQTRCCTALINYYLKNQKFDSALPLYARFFARNNLASASIGRHHQQKINQLETQSRILQLQRYAASIAE